MFVSFYSSGKSVFLPLIFRRDYPKVDYVSSLLVTIAVQLGSQIYRASGRRVSEKLGGVRSGYENQVLVDRWP